MVTSFHEQYVRDPAFAECLSPFILQMLYQTGSMFVRLSRVHPKKHSINQLEPIKQLLQLLDKRWRAAGE
jgi:hypothetical protein